MYYYHVNLDMYHGKTMLLDIYQGNVVTFLRKILYQMVILLYFEIYHGSKNACAMVFAICQNVQWYYCAFFWHLPWKNHIFAIPHKKTLWRYQVAILWYFEIYHSTVIHIQWYLPNSTVVILWAFF